MGRCSETIELINLSEVPLGEDYNSKYVYVNRAEIMKLRKKYKKQTGIVYKKEGN